MNQAITTSRHPYPLLRRFLIDVAITQVFNFIIALLLTFVVRLHSTFVVNLVVSVCIGTLAVTFIDGGRLLIWGDRRPPRLPFILLMLVSAPAAHYFGTLLASPLLGIPVESLDAARGRNATAMLIGTTLSFVFIIWFFWNRANLAQLAAEAEAEKARAAAIERQAMQAQLQMLQAQIEPHMLFNTLANLQGLIAADPPRAQHMLDQLIQYLRATLSSSRADKTSLAHEFSLMDAYLGLMKVRMGSRLAYRLDLPDALVNEMVPPMLMQPLVENAIKHGLEPKIDGGAITIRAERDGSTLRLTVVDTGLGLNGGKDSAPHDGSSVHVGLSNICERLQALYGERATLTLQPNTPSGVIAQLTIPL